MMSDINNNISPLTIHPPLTYSISEHAKQIKNEEASPIHSYYIDRGGLIQNTDRVKVFNFLFDRVDSLANTKNRHVDSDKVQQARKNHDKTEFMNQTVDASTRHKAIAVNAIADGAGTLIKQTVILPSRFAGLLLDSNSTAAAATGVGIARGAYHAFVPAFVNDFVNPVVEAAKIYGKPAPIDIEGNAAIATHNAKLAIKELEKFAAQNEIPSELMRNEYKDIVKVLKHYAEGGELAHAAFGLTLLSEVVKQAADWATTAAIAANVADPVTAGVAGTAVRAANALVTYPLFDGIISAVNAHQTMSYQTLYANVMHENGSVDKDAMRDLWITKDEAQDKVVDLIMSNHMEKDLRDARLARQDASLLYEQANASTKEEQDLLREKAGLVAKKEHVEAQIHQLRRLVDKEHAANVHQLVHLHQTLKDQTQALQQAESSQGQINGARNELDQFKQEIIEKIRSAKDSLNHEWNKYKGAANAQGNYTGVPGESAYFNAIQELAELAGDIEFKHKEPSRFKRLAGAFVDTGVAVGKERLVGLEHNASKLEKEMAKLDEKLAKARADGATSGKALSQAEKQEKLIEAQKFERRAERKESHAQRKASDLEAYRLATVAMTASKRAEHAAKTSTDPESKQRLLRTAQEMHTLSTNLLHEIAPNGQLAKLLQGGPKRCFKEMGANLRLNPGFINSLSSRVMLGAALMPSLGFAYSGVSDIPKNRPDLQILGNANRGYPSDLAVMGALVPALDAMIYDRHAARFTRSAATSAPYNNSSSAQEIFGSPHASSREKLKTLLESTKDDIDTDRLLKDANADVGLSVSKYARLLTPHPAQPTIGTTLSKPLGYIGYGYRRTVGESAGHTLSALRHHPVQSSVRAAKAVGQFAEGLVTYPVRVVSGIVQAAPVLNEARKADHVSKAGMVGLSALHSAKSVFLPPSIRPVSGLMAGATSLVKGSGLKEAVKTAGYSTIGKNTTVDKLERSLKKMEAAVLDRQKPLAHVQEETLEPFELGQQQGLNPIERGSTDMGDEEVTHL